MDSFLFFLEWDWNKEIMQKQAGFGQVWQEISEEEVVRRESMSLLLFILWNTSLLNLAVTGKNPTLLYKISNSIFYKELHIDIYSS